GGGGARGLPGRRSVRLPHPPQPDRRNPLPGSRDRSNGLTVRRARAVPRRIPRGNRGAEWQDGSALEMRWRGSVEGATMHSGTRALSLVAVLGLPIALGAHAFTAATSPSAL